MYWFYKKSGLGIETGDSSELLSTTLSRGRLVSYLLNQSR